MTIAQQIKATIETKCPGTFSLYAGYGMAGGQYVRWPTGHMEAETRNERGQCSMARYRYADNSTLTYKRRPYNQYSLIVGLAPTK
jgi:hypothetical protein